VKDLERVAIVKWNIRERIAVAQDRSVVLDYNGARIERERGEILRE